VFGRSLRATAFSPRLSAGSVNDIVQTAVQRAGISQPAAIDAGGPDSVPGIGAVVYSAHSLQAGFVTYAHLRGASDRAIAH
jgi:hypothetical protein